MKVFKVYFKIIKKNLPMLSIYIAIFMLFALLLTISGVGGSTSTFSETKNRVMIINNDDASPLTDGLVDYLTGKSVIVAPVKDEKAIQDALFYEDAAYVLTIPNGFSEDFLSGTHSLTLGKRTTPNSTAGVQLDMLVEKYLGEFNLYVKAKGIAPTDVTALKETASLVKADMQKETDVVWAGSAPTSSITKASYYFNYLPYSLLSIMILAVSSIMQVFAKGDLKKRMQCAPTPATRINLELLLGNLCFAVVVWAFMMILSLLLTGSSITDTRMQMLLVNAFVFSITALSLSFLLGHLIKGPGAQHSVANVIALGTSFISGVFVPQALLGDTVKYVASFTPTYWYVTAVGNITALSSFSWTDTKEIFMGMLIQLAFAAAFLVLALVIGRQRKRKSV
ncbi:MAG: ABC transporter permease [Eubacteriales bacterium]